MKQKFPRMVDGQPAFQWLILIMTGLLDIYVCRVGNYEILAKQKPVVDLQGN